MRIPGCTTDSGTRLFKWIAVVALAAAALSFVKGGVKYLYIVLPYLLLLACPLMHLLHHRGHKAHSDKRTQDHDGETRSSASQSQRPTGR